MRRGIEGFLVDIDDCLLPTNGEVSPEFYRGLEGIAQFIKRANEGTFPPIGWCTGRDRNYVEGVSFTAGLPNSFSVIESGIALFNPTTKSMPLNPALTDEVKAAFETIRRERLPQILKRFPDLFEYPGNMINIALERCHGVQTPIEKYYEVVKAELQDLEDQKLVIVHHSRIAVDISPVGPDGTPIDKASGVKFWSRYTGIDLAKVVGIGDSKGDFPMLKLVGYVGCPSNASTDCKKLVQAKGGYISPHEYSSGVADAISHFVSEKGLG